jgi:hypothetical protein
MCRDFNDGVAAIPLYSIIVLPFEFLPRDACSLQPWTHLVRRLSDPPDTFRAISKWPGREVAVVVHRVPARPDAAHVGFIFIDVMGNDHSGAPARSIIRRYESHGRLWHPRRTQLYLEGYCAYRRHQRCHWRKRRLRYVADFRAALGQAAACQYFVMWGAGRKEQWQVEKLRADPIRCWLGPVVGPV